MSRLAAAAAALVCLAAAAAAPAARAEVVWRGSVQDVVMDGATSYRAHNAVNRDLYAAGRFAATCRFYVPEDVVQNNAFYIVDTRARVGANDGFIFLFEKDTDDRYYAYYGLSGLDGAWARGWLQSGGTTFDLTPGWHTGSYFWDGTTSYNYFDGQLTYTQAGGYSGTGMGAEQIATRPFLGQRHSLASRFQGTVAHVTLATEFADVGMTASPGVASFTPTSAAQPDLVAVEEALGTFGTGLHRLAASSIDAELQGSFVVRARFRIAEPPVSGSNVATFGDATLGCGGSAYLVDTRSTAHDSGDEHGCYLRMDYCACCDTPGYEVRGGCDDSGAGVLVTAGTDPAEVLPLEAGVRYDLAFQVDKGAGVARLYLDGAQVGADVPFAAGTALDQTGAATVGARYGGQFPFTGEVDYFLQTDAPELAASVARPPVTCSLRDDVPATPELEAAASGLEDGDLVVGFLSDAARFTSVGWRFVGATAGACGDAASSGQNGWTHGPRDACLNEHTLRVPATAALKDCGFSAEPEDGGSVWYYEAVVEATTQEPGEDVFGQSTTLTRTTAFRVRVELPKSVDVSASAVAYGNVIQFALLSQQEVDTSTPTAAFKWTLVTSVQYPYELAAKEVTEETAHDFESLGLSLSAASVACPASGACTQTFEIAATESTSCELTDAELKSVFTIGCRSQFTGACDTPEGVETDTATFTVSTDSFCARVVEVATVTPTLTTSTSQGGASAADFVLQTTLFGRVTFAIEAGLSVTSTRLLSLDLVSEETVKPVTGAGVQDSAVVSAISFVESDQGGTAPHLDFQFQLNTDSVKFAVGGGQASMTITAVVEVTYDGAASQRFEVQAVSGPGSVSTAASSTVGVSTPAAPGSASTAGSTVLGVSTGTAMVAGVGLVAVVALAAGAAVVGRNRRASAAAAAAKRASSSTASLSIALEEVRPAAAAVPGAVTFAAGEEELGRVRDAYGAL